MHQFLYCVMAWLLSGVITLFFFRLGSTRRCETAWERFVMSRHVLAVIQVIYWPYAIYLFVSQF